MITTIDHGAVRELRMNRPPVNALNVDLIRALRNSIDEAAALRAVVISGPPGMFTAGLDVPALLQFDRAGMTQLWSELYRLMKSLATSPIPVCAAVTGHAPAGGTVIALFCDYRIATRGDFKLGLTEVQAAIPVPPVIVHAARRQVGARYAERITVGGLMLSPDQALEIGLVDELAAPEEVVEKSVAWCRSMAALPKEAMLATRKRARADLAALFEGDVRDELNIVLDGWFSAETQAMLQAMVARLKGGTSR